MFPQKERTPEESDALIHALAWNDEFGCYSKNGFKKAVWPEIVEDARWIIYFDVDDVHEINIATGGYAAFDAMMQQVFSTLRLTDYVSAAQLNSGDEFFICLTKKQLSEQPGELRQKLDPQTIKERLIDELKKHCLTATFSIVPVVSPDLDTNLKPAIDEVFLAKQARGEGRRH